MPGSSFFGFLARSMRALERESPQCHREIVREISGLRARLTADGVSQDAWFDGECFVVGEPRGAADIHVAFNAETVFKIIDGEVSLEEAIYSEKLWIRGAIEVVERFHAGILAFVGGSMRSPAFPQLLAEFRSA